MPRVYFLIFVHLFSQVTLAKTLTFEEVQKKVLVDNREIQAAQKETQAAQKEKGQLLRSFFPELSLTAGQDSFRSGTEETKNQPHWSLEASINLYKGGLDSLEGEILETYHHVSQKRLSLTQIQQLAAASEAYWNSVFIAQKQRLLNEEIARADQALTSATRRKQRGVATESDELEFELYRSELALEKTKNDLASTEALQSLRILLNLEDSESIQLPAQLTPLKSELPFFEKQTRILKELLQSENDLLTKKGQQTQKVWIPQLDFFMSSNQYNERIESAGPGSLESENRETTLGLRLTLDLGNIWMLNSQKNAQRLTNEAQALRSRQEAEAKLLEATQNQKKYEMLKAQLSIKQSLFEKTRKYFRLTLQDYDRGVKNSPDVLSAMERAYQAELNYLENIKDLNALTFSESLDNVIVNELFTGKGS